MKHQQTHSSGYGKFALTLSLSFIVMYLAMFLNMDQPGHYHTSLTRLYMTILMVAPMAIIMLVMMGNMYSNKKLNGLIIAGAVLIFGLTLSALRTQTPIDDIQYMKAMIPHHSSAIMTSKNASIKDPEVKKLSEDIIEAQLREIAEMESMLKRLQASKSAAE